MDTRIKQAAFLANLLDNKFEIAGIKFGVDHILGLFPGLGDFIALALSLYIVQLAKEVGLPNYRIIQMLFNLLIDFLIGVIPILGDIFDVGFKANIRNLKILEEATREIPIKGKLIA